MYNVLRQQRGRRYQSGLCTSNNSTEYAGFERGPRTKNFLKTKREGIPGKMKGMAKGTEV